MVLNTLSIGAAVTPTVVHTYLSHYLNRKPRRQKPTAHISYDEGLALIRQFLHHASFHTVEELQAFTSGYVPSPRMAKTNQVNIPEESISSAAKALISQLGHKGIDKVGGSTWWQWRREGSTLKAEWIEMRGDYQRRKKTGDKGSRVILYVHGGAYFFARYRLAPQFPFPCGLHDCLSAYLYLLSVQDPSTIIFSGDSAGGGMVVSMLVILRDQGIPLPAGVVLISPWVDLTHSFPSVAGENKLDYIPSHGFFQKPSAAWPPPNADDMEQIAMHAVEQVVGEGLPRKSTSQERREATEEAVQGFTVMENDHNPAGTQGTGLRPGNTIPSTGINLSIMIEGNLIEIKDQIQMYASNQLISHPLVSPVLQPSLGGLPPLLILTGGGEILRDEQIYLAHKAANPSKYPPSEAYLDEYPEARDIIAKWKPTDVQLQVWDSMCHVAPTLSFTRPAKFMYRSIAQFSAWSLARAQKAEIEILDDDNVSIISSGSDTDSDTSSDIHKPRQEDTTIQNGVTQGAAVSREHVGKAGDSLPAFRSHMIRQHVDRHGIVYPLAEPSSLPALQIQPNDIGVIKPGPVKKWLAAKKEWDTKFSREKRRVQKQRAKEMAKGYQGFGDDEVPPPSALAGRRGLNMPKEKPKKRSIGLSLWGLWGSSHDEKTISREEKADKEPEVSTATIHDGANARPFDGSALQPQHPRSRSRRRTVVDAGQTTADTPAVELLHRQEDQEQISPAWKPNDPSLLSPSFIPLPRSPAATPGAQEEDDFKGRVSSPDRPTADGVAFPFKLGRSFWDDGVNASTFTLTSMAGFAGEREVEKEEGNEKEMERPGIERFETARED